jgi:hypothetical protein
MQAVSEKKTAARSSHGNLALRQELDPPAPLRALKTHRTRRETGKGSYAG